MLFESGEGRADALSDQRLGVGVDVPAGFLEDLAHLGDDLAEVVDVDVAERRHLDVGLVAPSHALEQLILRKDLAPGAKVAVSGMHQRIPGFAIQLLGGLDGVVDPSLDRAQGIDSRSGGTGHLALAALVSDLKVGAPLGLLEQCEERRGEQDVASEDDDLVVVGQSSNTLGNFLDSTVIEA